MIDYKIMLFVSLACLTFAEWSGVIDIIKYYINKIRKRHHTSWIRLKPFDCAKCLTLWVSLAIFIHLDYKYWAILYAFANSGLTIIINKAFERIAKK